MRAFFTALKALYLISVLSKGSIDPRAVIEGLNYLRKSYYPQLAVSKHPRRGAGGCGSLQDGWNKVIGKGRFPSSGYSLSIRPQGRMLSLLG